MQPRLKVPRKLFVWLVIGEWSVLLGVTLLACMLFIRADFSFVFRVPCVVMAWMLGIKYGLKFIHGKYTNEDIWQGRS